MTYDQTVRKLTERYQTIFTQKGSEPTWAYRKISRPQEPIHPPIPFVGKHYFEQPFKSLLYASAENLRGYDGYLDDDLFALHRHRYYFEQSIKASDMFFPWVHIAPINNGALVLCAFHILSRLTNPNDMDPADFLETIAFGNYGKYTFCPTDRTRNIDCASQPDKLAHSQPCVAADLEILRPDYVIMVGTTYHGAGAQKAFVDGVCGGAKVIPIYQITPTTVNSPNLFRKHAPLTTDELHPTLARWYTHFHAGAVSGAHFMSVFSYLDHILHTDALGEKSYEDYFFRNLFRNRAHARKKT